MDFYKHFVSLSEEVIQKTLSKHNEKKEIITKTLLLESGFQRKGQKRQNIDLKESLGLEEEEKANT